MRALSLVLSATTSVAVETWTCCKEDAGVCAGASLCKDFNATFTVETAVTGLRSWVDTITVAKEGCAPLLFKTQNCSDPAMPCPSAITGSPWSLNFEQYSFMLGSTTFDGIYVASGFQSLYETSLEWDSSLGPSGACSIPSRSEQESPALLMVKIGDNDIVTSDHVTQIVV